MLDITSNKATRLFLILGGIFITNALVAEFIGVKIFQLEDTLGIERASIKVLGFDLSFQLTAGVLLWPVVFILTDIINEYYGKKGVRLLSFLTAGLIAYSFAMISLGIGTTPADWWIGSAQAKGVADYDLAYRTVFGQGLWIIIGSLVAFLVGQILDVFVFHKLKQLTGEKYIWLRSTGSTLVSQLVDSFVVLFIAFYVGAGWPMAQVLAVCTVNYIYKVVMAIALTPAIYLMHGIIERFLGHDVARQMKQEAMERSKGFV
ncbi:queuosine precursor transporter [soil metagenome]